MLFQFGGGTRLGNVVQRLENLGVIDILFPFFLVYVIVFGVLQKIELFGANKAQNKRLNSIIALVMGMAFIYPHVSGRYNQWGVADPVVIINNAIPQVGIVMIAVVLFLIMIGLFGVTELDWYIKQGAIALSLIIIIFVFSSASGILNMPMFSFLNDPDLQFFLVFILAMGLLIWFLGSGAEEDDDPAKAKQKRDDLWQFLTQGPPKRP